MKQIQYTGSSKLISRIVHLLNRKAPLPLDGQGDAVWGTNGQVLTTDGQGNTSWTTPQGGGGDVTDVEVNGTSVVNAQGVAEVTVPTKTSDLNNDSGFITNLVNDLANYYTKSQTYTQAEVNQLISGIVTLNILVVQALPTQDISTTTIYLVPKQDTGTSDIYDEYLYINNAWELIGTTQIDLSNYVTTTDLSTALADYVTSVGLATILADYVQSSDLATVATSGDYSDLQNKPTIPDELADLADDSTHRTVTDAQISTWNGKSDFSGSYNDLTDKPTIPTVNDGTLTIQQNGTTLGTFTANQSGNTTVNLTGGGGSTYTEGDGIDISAQDVISVDTTFTEASTRANIASGESFATILGKIKKFFADLKTVAFTGKSSDLDNDAGFITSSGSITGNAATATKATQDGSGNVITSTYVKKSGDTMTGMLSIQRPTNYEPMVECKNTDTNAAIAFGVGSGGSNRGLYDRVLDRWVFQVGGTSVYVNASSVPYGKTLASIDQIPSDFVSKANGGTFDGYITINGQSGTSTPLRIKVTNAGDCWQEFSNSGGYLGWYGAGSDKKPYFMSASDNTARELIHSGNIGSQYVLGVNNYYGSRPSSANVSFGDGKLRHFKATSSMTTGKPSSDAHIIHMAWDNTGGYDAQIATPTLYNGGHMSWRNQIAGTWQAWKTIIDSSGGTINGALTLSSGYPLYVFTSDNTKVASFSANANGTAVITSGSNWINLQCDSQVQCRNKADTGWVPIAASSYPGTGSSRKVKENIKPLTEDEAKKILDIETVTFDYKETHIADKSRFGWRGVIAEDVEPIIPSAVVYGVDKYGEPCVSSVDYMRFVPYLIKMTQMQQAQIDELKAEIALLKGEKA